MMPTASPRWISKLTSLSAQTSSSVSPWMMGLPVHQILGLVPQARAFCISTSRKAT